MTKEDKKYEVGYGKPPKSGQFKKGQSGNPKGRRKGSKSARTIVREMLDQKVTIGQHGKTRRVKYMEAFWQQMAAKGLNGSMRDHIAFLKAMHDYVPDLLKGDDVCRDIRIEFVTAEKRIEPEKKPKEPSGGQNDDKDDEDDSWLK